MRDPVLPVPPPGGRLRRGLRAFVGALSDDELARRAGDGDEQAFAALFRRRADHLQAIAQRVLRDPDDARDAVQSALMKGLVAIRGGQLRGDVRPWMSRICLHEAISVLRVRTPWIELDERQHVAVERSPEAALLLREQLQAVAADLATLPERQRRALLLREVAELPYDRVCVLLGLRPDAARQAVHEARVTLRELAGGREERCVVVRAILADADGRTRRSRRLRGHLRACEGCRTWERARRPGAPRRLAALLPGAWLPKLLVAGGAASTVSAGQLPTVAAVVAIAGGSGALPVLSHPPAARHPAASASDARDGVGGADDVRGRLTMPSTTGGGRATGAGSATALTGTARRPVLRLTARRAGGGAAKERERAGTPDDRLAAGGARDGDAVRPSVDGPAAARRSPGAHDAGTPLRAGAPAAASASEPRTERPTADASRSANAARGDGATTTEADRRPHATAVTGAAPSSDTRRIPAAGPSTGAAEATPTTGGDPTSGDDVDARESATGSSVDKRD